MRSGLRLAVTLLVAAVVAGCSAAPTPDEEAGRAPAWEQRPVVELSFDVAADLRTVTGLESVVFTPDLPVCELVFRAWPNKPLTARDGTSLVVTDARVDGAPVAPQARPAGAPEDAPGTLVELPLARCVDAGVPVRAELGFELTLGEDADERLGVSPDEQVAWFAGGFPLLAWVRGEGWAREDAVSIPGETATSEDFALSALTVTAPDGHAVLGTGTPDGTEPGARPGTTAHRFTAEAVRNVAVSVGRYEVEEQDVDGVRIRVGVPAGGSRVPAQDWIDAHAEAIASLEELFGPFPYDDLWVTIAPSQTSGLEFPTALQYGDLGPRQVSGLVAHELAHQWVYSLVGNNQARDPWIDEAFATFGEAVATGREDEYRLSAVPDRVAGYLGYPMEYWAEEGGFGRYYQGVYEQGAAVLLEAREQVGPDEFDAALRDYLDTRAHRVAHPDDVEAAFAELPEVVDLLREYGAFAAPDR